MSPRWSLVAGTLVRAVVVAAAGQLAARYLGGDDPLGVGFTGLLTVVAVSGLWAAWDGSRSRLGSVLLRWLVVGVLANLLEAVYLALPVSSGERWDLGAFSRTFVEFMAPDLALFTVLVVTGPALVGALIGSLIRSGAGHRASSAAAPPGRDGVR